MTTAASDPGADAVRAHALLLAWYRDMGVDAALDAEPVDWLQRGDNRPGADYAVPVLAVAPPVATPATPSRAPAARAANHPPWEDGTAPPQGRGPAVPAPRPTPRAPLLTASSAQQPPATRQFPTATPDDSTLAAQVAALSATSLDDLALKLTAFDGCALKATAKSLCFYRGAQQARLMVVGEAPRAEDDKAGKPFAGLLGAMLDKMLGSIGLDETRIHITNVVYWRPPGNRTPTAQEIAVCRPFFERQVSFVKPEFILLLGGPVTAHFFDRPEGIMKMRGKWRDIEIGGNKVQALVTLHPENLLKTPLTKKMAWRDLLTVDAALNPPKVGQNGCD